MLSDLAKMLVKSNPATITHRDVHGALPIHLALHNPVCDIDTIDTLCSANTQTLSMPDKFGYLPLHWAVNHDNCDLEIVALVLSFNKNAASTPCQVGSLPLHWAVGKDASKDSIVTGKDIPHGTSTFLTIVRMLISAFPDGVRTCCDNGWLPIHWCVNRPDVHIDMLKLLLDSYPLGAQVPLRNTGHLPLHILAGQPNPSSKAVDVLVQIYPQALQTPDDDGYLPLHCALDSPAQSLDAIRIMLEVYQEAVSARTKNGWLPLHIVLCSDHVSVDVVRHLLTLYPQAAHETANELVPMDSLPASQQMFYRELLVKSTNPYSFNIIQMGGVEYIERKWSPLSKASERSLDYITSLLKNVMLKNPNMNTTLDGQSEILPMDPIPHSRDMMDNMNSVDSQIIPQPGGLALNSIESQGQMPKGGQVMMHPNGVTRIQNSDMSHLPPEHYAMQQLHEQQRNGPIHGKYFAGGVIPMPANGDPRYLDMMELQQQVQQQERMDYEMYRSEQERLEEEEHRRRRSARKTPKGHRGYFQEQMKQKKQPGDPHVIHKQKKELRKQRMEPEELYYSENRYPSDNHLQGRNYAGPQTPYYQQQYTPQMQQQYVLHQGGYGHEDSNIYQPHHSQYSNHSQLSHPSQQPGLLPALENGPGGMYSHSQSQGQTNSPSYSHAVARTHSAPAGVRDHLPEITGKQLGDDASGGLAKGDSGVYSATDSKKSTKELRKKNAGSKSWSDNPNAAPGGGLLRPVAADAANTHYYENEEQKEGKDENFEEDGSVFEEDGDSGFGEGDGEENLEGVDRGSNKGAMFTNPFNDPPSPITADGGEFEPVAASSGKSRPKSARGLPPE